MLNVDALTGKGHVESFSPASSLSAVDFDFDISGPSLTDSVDGLPPEIPSWDNLSSILFDDGTRKTDAGACMPVGEQLERSSIGPLARATQEGMLAEGTDRSNVTDMTDMTDTTGMGARIPHAEFDIDIDIDGLLRVNSPTTWMQPMLDAEWMKVPTGNTANMIGSKALQNPPLQKTVKKKGPRFKYIYDSPEQAAEARRQRNRAAALRSYHQKREYMARLEAEVAELEREHAGLMKVLDEVKTGVVVDIEGMADVERHLKARLLQSAPCASVRVAKT